MCISLSLSQDLWVLASCNIVLTCCRMLPHSGNPYPEEYDGSDEGRSRDESPTAPVYDPIVPQRERTRQATRIAHGQPASSSAPISPHRGPTNGPFRGLQQALLQGMPAQPAQPAQPQQPAQPAQPAQPPLPQLPQGQSSTTIDMATLIQALTTAMQQPRVNSHSPRSLLDKQKFPLWD